MPKDLTSTIIRCIFVSSNNNNNFLHLKISIMTTFKITYNGNSSRFRNLNYEINANSAREAVEKYYAQFLSSDYFPQDDGSIFDQNGDKVADAGDDYIEYDGGYFEAEQQQSEK